MKVRISILGIAFLLVGVLVGYSFSYKTHDYSGSLGDIDIKMLRHGNVWNGCWLVEWEKHGNGEDGHGHEQYFIACGK